MQYIRAFFGFWRKFIVGDDSRIAVVIMWTFLFVDSLVLNFMNSWFVVPAVVIVLLGVLMYDAVSRKTAFPARLSATMLFLIGTVPMLLVTALPVVLTRSFTGVWSVEYVLLPLAIYIAIASLSSIVVGWVLQQFPLLTLFILGVISFACITYWQVPINTFSQNIVVTHYTLAVVFSLTIAIVFVGAVYRLVRRR